MRAKAFAPGHITGFFEIRDGPRDPLRKGSRGAGVNLSLGVLTSVDVREAACQDISILVNGKESDAATTLRAARRLLGRRRLRVEIRSGAGLPVGQGFGMSAAGALSASLAIGSVLGMGHLEAGRAAHVAEIEQRTGLGDVAAQLGGGWEMRLRPGYPPYGVVDRFLFAPRRIALCVCGDAVPTKSVLGDPEKRAAICREGRRAMKRIRAAPTIGEFFSLSLGFARSTGLAGASALSLAEDIAASGHGLASVSMIGNSVFATGRMDMIARIMKGRGRAFFCGTDTGGARVVG